MTCNVFGRTLSTQSINQTLKFWCESDPVVMINSACHICCSSGTVLVTPCDFLPASLRQPVTRVRHIKKFGVAKVLTAVTKPQREDLRLEGRCERSFVHPVWTSIVEYIVVCLPCGVFCFIVSGLAWRQHGVDCWARRDSLLSVVVVVVVGCWAVLCLRLLRVCEPDLMP